MDTSQKREGGLKKQNKKKKQLTAKVRHDLLGCFSCG